MGLMQSPKTHIYMCGLKGMESGMEECFGPLAEKNGIVWKEFAKGMKKAKRYLESRMVSGLLSVYSLQLPWGAPSKSHGKLFHVIFRLGKVAEAPMSGMRSGSRTS